MRKFVVLLFPLVVWVSIGCDAKPASQPQSSIAPVAAKDAIAIERDKLSADDKALVESQEWCVINNDERLGSMGPPVKLNIDGQTVFVCCSSCKKEATSKPSKTLAKLTELKVKAKEEKDAKK